MYKEYLLKGSGGLLTALNANGHWVSTVNSDMSALKNNQPHYCPDCGGPLILKAGTMRIPHFAHYRLSNCQSSFSEGESFQHLLGKIHLYSFFRKQGYTVSIEPFVKEIRQRPDLLLKTKHGDYAIEYQCSPISAKLLLERSSGYESAGLSPVWIAGGLPFAKKSRSGTFMLSEFHWLLARTRLQSSLASYCSDSRSFHFLFPILPITSRKAAGFLRTVRLNDARMSSLLADYPQKRLMSRWRDEQDKWLEQKLIYGNMKDPFIQSVYESGQNGRLLPPEIGIPVSHMESVAEPPIVWQFYMWADCFRVLKAGDYLPSEEVGARMRGRAKKGHIRFRNGRFPDLWPFKPYLEALCMFGFFSRMRNGTYRMNKSLSFPNNMEECKQMHRSFRGQDSITFQCSEYKTLEGFLLERQDF